jgi:hypothetical protein
MGLWGNGEYSSQYLPRPLLIRCSYIVDFEDCHIFNVEKESPLEFTDKEFSYWGLDEEGARDYRVSCLRLTNYE